MADTTILVKSSSWKIKAALGLGGLAVIVILSFLYRLEIGIAVLLISGGAAVRVYAWAIGAYSQSRFEQRRLAAEIARIEAEATKAKAESYFIETNTGVFVLDGIVISGFYPAVSASKVFADVPALAEPEKPKLRKLLNAEWIHMLIVGPTNAGKTTVANHLIDNAPNGTACIAIDPHGKFNVWSRRAGPVIGRDRDYQAIDSQLADLITEMNRRYRSDEAHFQKILIVIDEWLSVLDNCPSARRFFDTIGSEARKVNMNLIITTISATADDLDCSAPVRDNLVQLTLNRTLKEQNLGELKWSKRDTELVELPGPYIDRLPLSLVAASTPIEVAEPPVELDSGPVAPMPNPTELKIFQLYQAGKSLNAIHKELYPDRSYGGNQANELKAVLARFGVDL